MSQTIVSIPGLHCPSCISLIKDVSSEFPALTHVDVDLASKRVTLAHDDTFDFAQWKQEIEALGNAYRVTSNAIWYE